MLNRIKYITAAVVCSVCVASVFSMSVSTQESSVNAEEPSGTAMLIGSVGDYAQWGSTSDATYPPLSGSQIATVKGDGQYTVSFSVSSGSSAATNIEFLCLQIADISSLNYPNLALNIDSVSVDGQALDYKTTPSNVNLSYNIAGKTNSRVFLTVKNGWGAAETEDIPSNTTISDNVTVTFTVSGMAGGPVAVQTPSETATPSETSTPSSTSTSDTTSNQQEQPDGQQNGQQSVTESQQTSTSVDNSTTGDNGIFGIIAAGVLAACVAAASCIKRR